MALDAIKEFRVIIVYNFAFSLVLSGPMLLVVTRALADLIYEKQVESAPGMMMGALLLVLFIEGPFAIGFYVFYASYDPVVRYAAISNFLLVGCLWLVSVFLTALKDYRSVSAAFGIGMLLAVFLGVSLGRFQGAAGMLIGFNVGLSVVLFLLTAKILAEYPYPMVNVFAFVKKFRTYWTLALSGFVYNLAIWIDKWIMWFAPESERLPSGLISYPHYDSAMFLAFLTITPSMAIFLVIVETRFFEGYLTFYRDLQRHANFRRITYNHQSLIAILVDGVRTMAVLQGAVTLLVILLAPKIFAWLGVDFRQIGMFRLGVFGSMFHMLTMALLIVLAYFDFRYVTLSLQAVFLVSNAGFTLVSMRMGFPYYGYGYFLASLVTFVAAYGLTYLYLRDLPYQSFVRHNRSIQTANE